MRTMLSTDSSRQKLDCDVFSVMLRALIEYQKKCICRSACSKVSLACYTSIYSDQPTCIGYIRLTSPHFEICEYFFSIRYARKNSSGKRNTKHTPTSQPKHTHTYTNTHMSSIMHQLVKIQIRHTNNKGGDEGTSLARSVVVFHYWRLKPVYVRCLYYSTSFN